MIQVIKGDISRLDFDVIVNAANEQLKPGSGVCGAIFKQAGNKLIEECSEIGYCPSGQAVLTRAYDLPSKWIIHTVGPVYSGIPEDEQVLKACYWNSLCIAYDILYQNQLDRLSLAFPCIATGVYGFPHQKACLIAIETVKELMKKYPDAKKIDVTFVTYQQIDYQLYKEALAK